jgi:hypothetical protein
MIFDQTTLLSDAQAVTADAASTNVIDLGPQAIARDIGKGTPTPILVQVVEDFATLTSLTVSLQVDSVENFASPKTVWSSGAIPVASLKQGYRFLIDYIPSGANERYLRLYYDVTGTDATAGKITAGVTMGHQTNG